MKPNPTLGFRQIHLDFHTSIDIPDVAAQWDADRFADTVKRANVDSVTCFAKCHHGHLYYDTKHPARHPSLPEGLDLLSEQVKALHKRGIRAPIYISVQIDEYACNTHPEWIALKADGSPAGVKPLEPGWRVLDMASPYRQYLAGQVKEIVQKFSPMDGAFFDMCWNQASLSHFRKQAMLREHFDPDHEPARNAYADLLAQEYMKEYSAIVRKHNGPDATVYFNSRPLSLLTKDLRWMTHVEVEALATGGWGYMYFPLNVRYVRSFGRPYMGMTSRFHKTWADFGGTKPPAALKFEISQMLAHGARCSIGDQLHPRGTLEQPAWDMIGNVYDYAKNCQPWCEDAVSAADVGVLCGKADREYMVVQGSADEGVTRMLMQLKGQFDFIERDMPFAKFRLLILPDNVEVDDKLTRKLDAFVAKGGAVLVCGTSALDAQGNVAWKALPIAGATSELAHKVTYLKPAAELAGELGDMNHVMYERGRSVQAAKGAQVLATVTEPYFDRTWKHFCSHGQTPAAKATRQGAALVKGHVGYIAYPIFSMFATHGNMVYKRLVQAVLSRMMGRPMVQTNAPSGAEFSVMRKGKATVLHVLYFTPERRTASLDLIEDEVPLVDVKVSMALPRKPKNASLAPQGQELAFDWVDGRAEFTIPRVSGHQMVVLE